MKRFYVYEHWRPDLDLCFWVGKGTGDRAYRFKRNPDYNGVIIALAIQGLCAEVRIVRGDLLEHEALRIECDRIAFWKQTGIVLTNRVDGGRGNRSLFVSEETRLKLRAANLGKKHSPETRAKMRESHKGKRHGGRPAGFKHSPATIAKIRASNLGQKRSLELREHIRFVTTGKKQSAETRAKRSASLLRNTNGRGGKGLKRSEETKQRMSKAWIGRPKSEETKAKISASLKARTARLKEITP